MDKDLSEHLKKARAVVAEDLDNISFHERLYNLALLGLEQMPLEKDFMKLAEYKIKEMKRDAEQKTKLLDMVQGVMQKQESRSNE